MEKSGLLMGWILVIFIISAGCNGSPEAISEATLTIAPPANPYQADPKTPRPSSTEPVVPTKTPLLLTATPFIHVIQPGDTLYGLALQYNISLDKLISVNSGLDSSLLSIGTEVIIPFEDDDQFGAPTPTPFPIPIGEPNCLPTREGGLWCFAFIENNREFTLENIAATFNLYDDENNLIQTFKAIPPLNYYFSGQKMPVAVLIPSPLPKEYQVSTTLLTAYTSRQSKPLTEITDQEISYNDQKTIANIEGRIRLNEDISGGTKVWVAAIALSQEKPVGIRKWISSTDIDPDQDIAFEITLYSLGPEIDQVMLHSELH